MVQLSIAEALEMTKSSREGLTTAEACDRLASSKPKSRNSHVDSVWALLLRQFRSPSATTIKLDEATESIANIDGAQVDDFKPWNS